MERIEQHVCFGGRQEVWKHMSTVLGCEMRFGVYLPPQTSFESRPVLYWLSGLTSTEQNFITKAGAQRYAAEHGLILVAPDTSPRGAGVADDAAYDLGQGASFYLNATEAPWAEHYRMFDYVTAELPALVESHFPATDTRSISGHSMGGHGALIAALKKPGFYTSVSAFAPIVAPSLVPWGQKVFAAYLGSDWKTWQAWDACALLASAVDSVRLFIDQGEADEFLEGQLKPHLLQEAAKNGRHDLLLRTHPRYDHSYYFIASFIAEHIAYHAGALSVER